MEAGEFSTVQDLADAEGISDRFVSRLMRLSYLSPDVLQRLVTQRVPLALSLNELIAVAELPWAQQMKQVFGGGKCSPIKPWFSDHPSKKTFSTQSAHLGHALSSAKRQLSGIQQTFSAKCKIGRF